jgi:hypothetical protein
MMNVLTRVIFEVKRGDRFYTLEFAPGSPAEEINQALLQMNQYVNQVITDEEAKKQIDQPTEQV